MSIKQTAAMAFVRALLAVLVLFGLHLSPQQLAGLAALAETALVLVVAVRSRP